MENVPPVRSLYNHWSRVGSSRYAQYLLLDSPQLQGLDHDPINDRVLGMPGKLGIAHQDNGMFVFEEYEKEVAHQMSLVNTNEPKDEKMPIDQWIISGVKKVFDKKN